MVGRVTLTTRVIGGASPARGGSGSPICRVDSPGAKSGQTASGSLASATLAQTAKAKDRELQTMTSLLLPMTSFNSIEWPTGQLAAGLQGENVESAAGIGEQVPAFTD